MHPYITIKKQNYKLIRKKPPPIGENISKNNNIAKNPTNHGENLPPAYLQNL
ncbi:MAG: hypothetical protein ACNYPD_05760 [Candidatus Halichondribacter symbioticus]